MAVFHSATSCMRRGVTTALDPGPRQSKLGQPPGCDATNMYHHCADHNRPHKHENQLLVISF